MIETQKDIWWDIRIQPNLKTIEFRVCDAINDLERLEIIVALTQALCRYSTMSKEERLPRQVLKQNVWNAVRYGLEGYVVYEEKRQNIKEVIRELSMEFFALNIIEESLLGRIEKLLDEKSISTKMIEKFEETQSILEVEKLGIFL